MTPSQYMSNLKKSLRVSCRRGKSHKVGFAGTRWKCRAAEALREQVIVLLWLALPSSSSSTPPPRTAALLLMGGECQHPKGAALHSSCPCSLHRSLHPQQAKAAPVLLAWAATGHHLPFSTLPTLSVYFYPVCSTASSSEASMILRPKNEDLTTVHE